MEEVKRVNGKLVLGNGEVTGHLHTMREGTVKMFRHDDETRILMMPVGGVLRHEKGDVPAEHRDQVLPAGRACVVQKRQAQGDAWTRVED